MLQASEPCDFNPFTLALLSPSNSCRRFKNKEMAPAVLDKQLASDGLRFQPLAVAGEQKDPDSREDWWLREEGV